MDGIKSFEIDERLLKLKKLTEMKYRMASGIRNECEERWSDIVRDIPWINLCDLVKNIEGCEIKMVPPFGGYLCRFYLQKKEYSVSVLLDYYNINDWEEGPHWEVSWASRQLPRRS